jgi:hypothetical protein
MIVNAIATAINHYPIFLLITVGTFALYTNLLAGNKVIFRDDVVSGLIVLIAGIPAGLFLDSLRLKKEEAIKQIENRKQELVILQSLKVEITQTIQYLETRYDLRPEIIVSSCVKLETWDIFLNSGKLNLLQPEVLAKLSLAYGLSRKIAFVESLIVQSFTMSSLVFSTPDGTKSGTEILLDESKVLAKDFISIASETLMVLKERIEELQNDARDGSKSIQEIK